MRSARVYLLEGALTDEQLAEIKKYVINPVEARRSDKSYPMTSPELMRELGAYLLGKHNYLKVDVHNPQFKVVVEIRDYGAYIHNCISYYGK